jgi:hypothetical protein
VFLGGTDHGEEDKLFLDCFVIFTTGMKKLLLFFIVFHLLFANSSKAQINHVLNSSFENLNYIDTIHPWIGIVQYWHGTDSLNIAYNPDIYYTYKNKYAPLPITDVSWGGGGVYQYPRTGKVVLLLSIFTDSLF